MGIISETSFFNRSFSETHPPSFPFSRSRFFGQQGRRWKPNFPDDWGTSRSWREISPATQKSRGLEEDVRAMVTKIVDYVVFLIKFWTNHFSKQRVMWFFNDYLFTFRIQVLACISLWLVPFPWHTVFPRRSVNVLKFTINFFWREEFSRNTA